MTQCSIPELPVFFPTHRHDSELWTALGRTVASFGCLEEVLAKAILALSGSKNVSNLSEQEQEAELQKWGKNLENAASGVLSGLLKSYKKEYEEYSAQECCNQLIKNLEEIQDWRNILCHGSWRLPNEEGLSKIFFIKKNMDIFDGEIGVHDLLQIQRGTAEAIYDVIKSVKDCGLNFPGLDTANN